MPNYKEITEVLIPNLLPFKHADSMSAQITIEDGFPYYTIWSYSTEVASYDLLNQRWWITSQKYSSTTSRQVSRIKLAAHNVSAQRVEFLISALQITGAIDPVDDQPQSSEYPSYESSSV